MPFPRLQVGFQTGQEVLPGRTCGFKELVSLSEPIMREDHLCPIVDWHKLPGDTGPPLWRCLPGNPAHFLVLVQFGHL